MGWRRMGEEEVVEEEGGEKRRRVAEAPHIGKASRARKPRAQGCRWVEPWA